MCSLPLNCVKKPSERPICAKDRYGIRSLPLNRIKSPRRDRFPLLRLARIEKNRRTLIAELFQSTSTRHNQGKNRRTFLVNSNQAYCNRQTVLRFPFCDLESLEEGDLESTFVSDKTDISLCKRFGINICQECDSNEQSSAINKNGT